MMLSLSLFLCLAVDVGAGWDEQRLRCVREKRDGEEEEEEAGCVNAAVWSRVGEGRDAGGERRTIGSCLSLSHSDEDH